MGRGERRTELTWPVQGECSVSFCQRSIYDDSGVSSQLAIQRLNETEIAKDQVPSRHETTASASSLPTSPTSSWVFEYNEEVTATWLNLDESRRLTWNKANTTGYQRFVDPRV